MSTAIVIVGSGLAGYNLAREVRKLDAKTDLIIISQDAAAFYSKPMLSNALAQNKTVASLVMKSAEKMSSELNAQIIHHTSVERIDKQAKTITLSNSQEISYKDLILAVGAQPSRIHFQGDASDQFLSVNHLDDFDRFAQAIDALQNKPSKRVAILGAGLIGCEFSNDLLARGISPMVVDIADRVLPRLLPTQASSRLQLKLENAGVQFHLSTHVVQVNRLADEFELQLSNDSTIYADVVLSAIGLKPSTSLAERAELSVNQGIVVDRFLATSHPHIYALGDCIQLQGSVMPYVLPLMAQARCLAKTLTGEPCQLTYPAMPITVKTPICPTVICPPRDDTQGSWMVEESQESLIARFVSKHHPAEILGFVVQGDATSMRQSLAAQVPAWLS